MKIWFVEIGEPLPVETDQRPHRYGNFCRYLAARGHSVTWWASGYSHMPKKHFVEETKKIEIFGYTLWMIKSKGYNKNVSVDRILHNKKFAKDFYELAQSEDKPDVIVCPIPTIENASVCLKLSKQWRIPIVADIRDEWPDELINLLPPKFRWLGKLILFGSVLKMKKFCSEVTGIMGVTRRQVEFGLKYAQREFSDRDFIFPLGYPELQIEESQLHEAKKRLKFDFSKYKTNICFFGTLGRYFEFDSLAYVAKKMPDVGFIVAGEGDKKEELTHKLRNLPNVFLPGWLNSAEIKYVAKRSDIGLAPYVGSESFSMPNKIFEYMSNGLIICTSLKGEILDLLKRENMGGSFTSYDGESLYKCLEVWCNDLSKIEDAKIRSRKVFDQNYSHEVVFKKAENYLNGIVSRVL